jgi:hypothetical protein
LSEPRYSEEQVRRWLGFLARNMLSRGQTIFLVENLQPTWLMSQLFRRWYIGVTRTILSILLGLVVYFTNVVYFAYERQNVSQAALLVLAGGTMAVAITANQLLDRLLRGGGQVMKAGSPKRVLMAGAFLGQVILMLIVAVLPARIVWPDFPEIVYLGVCPVAAVSTATAFNRVSFPLEEDIRPVERLSWSWRLSLRELCSPLALIAMLVAIVVAVCFPSVRMVAPIVAGGSLLARAIDRGFETASVPLKTRPNSGIWLSSRNAALFIVLALAVPAATIWGVLALTDDMETMGLHLRLGLAIAMSLFLPVALSRAPLMGAMAWAYHFVLRGLLAAEGDAPLLYVRFLDYAADNLGFLQKVGGGYTFMHRYLLEYFAAEAETEHPEISK